jgi:hypothetical protein
LDPVRTPHVAFQPVLTEVTEYAILKTNSKPHATDETLISHSWQPIDLIRHEEVVLFFLSYLLFRKRATKTMSEDHIKYVTVKRQAKKKSGYSVEERDGEYFVSEAPARARVNVGDKIVTINGITDQEFTDEDDANDLIESMRIVVIPADEIDEYDAAVNAEDGEEEEEQEEEEQEEESENVSPPASPKKGGKGKTASAPKDKKKKKVDDSDQDSDHDESDKRGKGKPKGKGKKGAAAAAAAVGAGAIVAAAATQDSDDDEAAQDSDHDEEAPESHALVVREKVSQFLKFQSLLCLNRTTRGDCGFLGPEMIMFCLTFHYLLCYRMYIHVGTVITRTRILNRTRTGILFAKNVAMLSHR